MMKAKADPHKFTLYHSDFLDGTDRFSPTGAAGFKMYGGASSPTGSDP